MAHGVKIRGIDKSSQLKEASVLTKSGLNGLITFDLEDAIDFRTKVKPFLNSEFGISMNQNAAFSGKPLHIHDGGDNIPAESGTTDSTPPNKLVDFDQNFTTTVAVGMTVDNTTDVTSALVTAIDSDTVLSLDADIMTTGEDYEIGYLPWIGSNISGTKVTFSSTDQANTGTASVKIDNPTQGDEWEFVHSTDVTITDYTALSFFIYIDKDWSTDIVELYCFDDSLGVEVGIRISISDYFNENTFDVWQHAVVPFSAFEFSETTFDSIHMQMTVRAGNKSPKFYMDDIQLEELGTPIEFLLSSPTEIFHLHAVRLSIADDISGVVINGTMTGLSYDAILGISKLANGIIFKWVENGITQFSQTLTCLADFITSGLDISNSISDVTNTFITMIIRFEEPIIIEGAESQNFMSFTINDDLAPLLKFEVSGFGRIGTIE